jgi:4-hydroxy-3-methylbut-2-enyl diphosphate reductase
MSKKNLFVPWPHGFCAGVENAIKSLEELLDLIKKLNLIDDDEKVWGYHEIVHNDYLTNHFIDRGVIFTNDIEQIPDKAWVVFSAHGVGKTIVEKAKQKDLKIVDLTCPLVFKVHRQVLKFAELGCQKIIYIGDKNHQESKGTLDRILLAGLEFETIYETGDLEKLDLKTLECKKLAYLSQTTLNADEVQKMILELKRIFPNILGGALGEICHATKNRQVALKKVFEYAEQNGIYPDLLIVIGSKTSSNSNKLAELGKKLGEDFSGSEFNSLLVNNIDILREKIDNLDSLENVILTAGASAPKVLIDEMIEYFVKTLGFELTKVNFTDEEVVFYPPKILRDLKAL